MKRERSNDASGSGAKNFDFLHSLVSSRYVLDNEFFFHYSITFLLCVFILKFNWMCRGDYDLIFDGIHENILQLHYHDPVMDKTVRLINDFESLWLFCSVCL